MRQNPVLKGYVVGIDLFFGIVGQFRRVRCSCLIRSGYRVSGTAAGSPSAAVGSELEIVGYDLGAIALNSVLLPRAGLHPTLDVHGATFLEPLTHYIGQFSEGHDIVVLGLLLFLSVFVGIGTIGRYRELTHRLAAR